MSSTSGASTPRRVPPAPLPPLQSSSPRSQRQRSLVRSTTTNNNTVHVVASSGPEKITAGRACSSIDWGRLSFQDIPAAHYDHILTEVLKGMQLQCARAAEAQFATAARISAEDPVAAGDDNGARQRRGGGGVNEPTPLIAGRGMTGGNGHNTATSRLFGGGLAGDTHSLFARLQASYNRVMAEFAVDKADRDASAAEIATENNAHAVGGSFDTTLGELRDRRVQQASRLLQAAQEEADGLRIQLEDLREAHAGVHQELTRSYREYDVVQRQLLDLLSRTGGNGTVTPSQPPSQAPPSYSAAVVEVG